jgi:hypothetical protein
MEYNIDYRHYAIIEGCRVLIWRRNHPPRILYTQRFSTPTDAQEHVKLCQEHGVNADGRCTLLSRTPFRRRGRWQKPEFQR